VTGALWNLFFEGLWITIQLMVYSAALAAVVAFGVYPEPFARLADAARLVLAG